MYFKINRDEDNSGHVWDKENLTTLIDKKGSYDIYVCKNCGFKTKSRNIRILEIETVSKSKEKKFFDCPKKIIDLDAEPFTVGNTIIIKNIDLVSNEAKDLVKNSEHKIIAPPDKYKDKYPNSENSVWVFGQTEPVRLFRREFIFKT